MSREVVNLLKEMVSAFGVNTVLPLVGRALASVIQNAGGEGAAPLRRLEAIAVEPVEPLLLESAANLAAEGGTVSMPATHPAPALQMDPRLMYLTARRRVGDVKQATASTGPDEVAVIADVSDVAAWEALSEVRAGSVIGAAEGSTIVTGRIPVSRITAVRTQPFVKSLKGARPVRPLLSATIEETGARVDLLPSGHLADGGKGVVVGIVDYGCDFAHKNFITSAGATRLLCIWDQNGPTSAGSPFGYGRKYTRSEIDTALGQPNPYSSLGYEPEPAFPPSTGTHGTHVMDIAAGNGKGSGVPGVAPAADIVFVDIAHRDIPFLGPDVVGSSFGDSVQLLEAVKFIFDEAGNRPCVVNISLGTNGGPHDGTTLVEKGIDALVKDKPNRAVVIAASNSFDDGIHAASTVPGNGSLDLAWIVASNDLSQNELEVWFPAGNRLSVELIDPDGTSLLAVGPGDSDGLVNGSQVEIFIANRLGDPNNGDNTINIFMEKGLTGGRWIVRLKAIDAVPVPFHAWIERDNFSPSQFAPPLDNTHTLGSISCGEYSLVVGSYDAHKATKPISWFSSAGPTRDGRQKPEISAPGHDVLAAKSRTMTGVVRKSGTSMASPAVTGIVALVLAEALHRGISLDILQIRKIIIDSARRNPPAGAGWNDRYGAGRISAAQAVKAVMSAGAAPAQAPSSRRRRKAATNGAAASNGPQKKTARSKKPAARSRKP